MLPLDPEAPICHPNHQEEATPLLRLTLGDRRVIFPPRRGYPELGGHGENHKMGARADGSGRHIRPTNGHQVLGTG